MSRTNNNNNCKCNCRSKRNFPLNGECLTQCLVYKATFTTSNNSFVYYGTSEGDFKTRYNKHTKSLDTVNAWMRWWSWKQSIMGNLQKGLTIPMWFKTLRSVFIRKSFHHLCWSRHFAKQKNWTGFLVSPQKEIFVGQH